MHHPGFQKRLRKRNRANATCVWIVTLDYSGHIRCLQHRWLPAASATICRNKDCWGEDALLFGPERSRSSRWVFISNMMVIYIQSHLSTIGVNILIRPSGISEDGHSKSVSYPSESCTSHRPNSFGNAIRLLLREHERLLLAAKRNHRCVDLDHKLDEDADEHIEGLDYRYERWYAVLSGCVVLIFSSADRL